MTTSISYLGFLLSLVFMISNLRFVSIFGFRISDFELCLQSSVYRLLYRDLYMKSSLGVEAAGLD